METSKIIVDAQPFARALAAVIAVAPSKEPLDVIQFRIVADELVVAARSHTEAVAVEVPVYYLDVDYERDGYFEITRSEARALAAMKMKKEDPDDELRLGLLVHERWIHRTDESGLGLGLRAVKVRRCGNPYESALGDVPHALTQAVEKPVTEAHPKMDGRQWALVGKVAKALDCHLALWANSKPESQNVRTVIEGDGVAMMVLCADIEVSEAKEPSVEEPALEISLASIDDTGNNNGGKTARKVSAKPPKGLA